MLKASKFKGGFTVNKFLTIPLTILLAFSLTACNTNKDAVDDTEDAADDVVNDVTEDGNDKNTNNDIIDNNDKTKNDNGNNDNGNNDNKVALAEDVSKQLTQMEEVESANVLVTDNNAYVGVELKEGVDATEELKTKVADQVRASNGQYNNVYVTFNPDYAKQLSDYGDKIKNNEPVEGFFEEFSDSIKRIFPDAA